MDDAAEGVQQRSAVGGEQRIQSRHPQVEKLRRGGQVTQQLDHGLGVVGEQVIGGRQRLRTLLGQGPETAGHPVDAAEHLREVRRRHLHAGVLVGQQLQGHPTGVEQARGLRQHAVKRREQERTALNDVGHLLRAVLADAQFFLDQLQLVGVDLLEHAVGVPEQFCKCDRDCGTAEAERSAVVHERRLAVPAVEVDVLLTGRGQTGHPCLAGLRQLHRRVHPNLGIDPGRCQRQRLHLADSDTAQGDILIGHQPAGSRQLNREPIDRRQWIPAQCAQQHVGHTDQQRQQQCEGGHQGLVAVAGLDHVDDAVRERVDHDPAPAAAGAGPGSGGFTNSPGAVGPGGAPCTCHCPGSVGLGMTGTCGTLGPRPTIRS